MLISILLSLVSERPATLPAYLGRASYAAILKRMAEVDSQLSGRIHAGDGPKPLTCSGLLNAPSNREGTPIEAQKPYFVRVTGLTTEVSQALAAGLLDELPTHWELDQHQFQVAETICDSNVHPWSGRTDYAEIAAGAELYADRVPHRLTLEFASPTAFKSGGMTVPIPLPGLVFGSLVQRWNHFGPIHLSPEMRRFAEEKIAISRYRLHSRPVVQKNQALRMGGVGRATYAALGTDRYWLGIMHMLSRFALYGGVGVQTATGMGQVRCIE